LRFTLLPKTLRLELFATSLTYLVVYKNLSKSSSQYTVDPNKLIINSNIQSVINIIIIIFIIENKISKNLMK
jgi:hypothetical protein